MYFITPEKHIAFVTRVLAQLGIPREDARQAADVIAQSDISGVDSHGLSRLSMYAGRIKQGLVNKTPHLKKIVDNDSVMAFDGDNGLGLVNVPRVMDICIEKARQKGVAVATIKNSNHYGVGNYYALKAIKQNMISVLMTNTTPCMAPTGGTELLIGTNPVTIGVPAGKHFPVILDMATSTVAFGKLQAMARKDEKIPFGWAITKEGKPTDSAKEAIEGSVLPIAGYKGYGLAVIIDLLSAVLAGAAFAKDIGRLDRPNNPQPEKIGHFLAVIDVAKFQPVAEFKETVDTYIQTMKNSNKIAGVKEIFLPGEIELIKTKERKEKGIPVEPTLAQAIVGLAKEIGLAGDNVTFDELLN